MCVENVQIPERLCRTTWQVRYTEFFLLAPFINNKRHKNLETVISNNLTMKIIISFNERGK